MPLREQGHDGFCHMTNYFADWSKHRHVTFVIIEWWTCRRSAVRFANKYLRKIKIDLQTKVEICISTYSISNVDVVCYSATWWTKLNERNPA